MSRAGLRRLLEPRSIAVAGVSAKPGKHGSRVVANLRRIGFGGPVWGVNPSLPEIEGLDVVASMSDLPEPPDLVVAAVPAGAVADVVAASEGAGAVVVFASGFGEAGHDHAQQVLRETARSVGVRLIGPNSGGVIRPSIGLAASFLTCLERPAAQLQPARLAVVSQSGGIASHLNNIAAGRGDGIAVTISTGNEADIGLGEATAAVAGLEEVEGVVIVVETVRDGDSLLGALRSCSEAGKPVVASRLGSADDAGELLTSHTGALAIPEAVLAGLFAASGVPVAATPAEAYELASILTATRRPAGGRAAIVTHSGGFAIHLSDLAARAGVDLPEPSPTLAAAVGRSLDHGVAANPADLGAIIGGPERFAAVVGAFAASGEYDVVLAVSSAHPPAHTEARVESLLAIDSAVPIVHLWLAGDQADDGLRRLRAAGAPVAVETRAAVAALTALTGPAPLWSTPPVLPGPPSTWGLPPLLGEIARTAEDAVEVARSIGYPVALKAEAPGLFHKTEVSGVRLDLRGDDEVRDAFRDVIERLRADDAVSEVVARVQPHVIGLEMILGGLAHDALGPIVSVGAGGTLAELWSDVVFAPAPLDVEGASRMIERLRSRQLLDGYRGSAAADIHRLADIISTVSRGVAGGSIGEIEINPLTWDGHAWRVVDLLVVPPGV